ncbi:hypothetical protein C0993_006629 [Termitomyces sp. T159_Od127]|nr:hypothetical protein C0993_006629 [Termitomyces sp. T159_Od127]
MAPAFFGALANTYDRLAAFNIENLFVRKREPGPRRTVFVNENLPAGYHDAKGRVKPEHVYCTNQVLTSKYTIITFIPRNLLEQFRRVANIFFLAIAILQFFNKFSTISPGLVILPLLIVLGITALKDGYEDVKRHQSDRRVNHTPVRTLAGGSWANLNAMARKSRTFVRGIIPTRLRNKAKKGELVSAGPTPASDAGAGQPEVEHTDVEYDDAHEEIDMGPGLHLFGHHSDHSRPHWRKAIWEDVRVGDFVKIKDHEQLPADILICATSEDENVAFVETKNLDGETNLKSRHACAQLTHLRTAADCANVRHRFRVEADRPNVNMYKLSATLRLDSKDAAEKERKEAHPIDMQMMLLRGTVLRNTAWVIGIVIYTGQDTRIVMNSGGTPSKWSKVERQMNPQVFINLIILAIMAVVCAIVDSVLEHYYYPRDAYWLYNDNQSDDNPSINGLVTWAFALVTFQNIVPISLYISIEVVRTCQAAFIYFDTNIYHKKTGQPTLARSWNLSDDLGQIEYIFSDKTGTLTQNSMIFRQCSIAGKVYSGDPDVEDEATPKIREKTSTISSQSQDVVLPSDLSSSSSTAASPSPPTATHKPLPTATADPLTMPPPRGSNRFVSASLNNDLRAAAHAADPVRARALNGFFSVLALCHTVLTGTDPETGAMEYKAQSPDEAALVQAAADVGYVFRGREVDVLSLQTPFSEDDGEGTRIERYRLLNILEFTSARKRMSVVVRKLDEDDGRQMAHAAEEFFPEANLLSEEAVNHSYYAPPRPSTSSRTDYALRRINTGLSSIVGSNNGERPGGFVLVIDGSALEHALADHEHKSLLLKLATQCEGVVCCRVSPLQKALIVRLVKEGLGVMTLAIGDGANDVSMIQSADVGVGISGEEGLQAVNSSDYAIAQFRFLKRLLLVHGHWSYARNGNMILNFFYKNIVCIGVLWWFQIYCGWSSNYVFEYTFLLFWNSFWTIAPVIAIGIFDRIVDAHVLMDLPELYRYGREGRWFGLKWFTVYMFDALYQSAIIFFLILYAYFSPSSRTDGWQVTLNEFSTTMVFSAVIAANLFNGLNTNVWTGWVFFAVSIGIVLVLLYTAIYAAISPGWFVTPMYGYNHFLWPSAYFWLCMPLTICLALAPRYFAKAWKFGFAPDDIDIVRYIGKTDPKRDLAKDAYISASSPARPFARHSSSRRTSRTSFASERPPRPSFDPRNGSRTDMSTGMRSVHRGFDFSTEEGGVAMQRIQTNLSERRESNWNLDDTTQQNTNRNRRRGTLRHVLSVRRGFLRKKPSASDG